LDDSIPLIIWVGENEMKEGIVKVKSLNKHEEILIKRSELAHRIQEIIKDAMEYCYLRYSNKHSNRKGWKRRRKEGRRQAETRTRNRISRSLKRARRRRIRLSKKK